MTLTARGVLSPGEDLNICRLTGADISLNGPAQKVLVSVSSNTHIKHTVIEIWIWVHLLMAEAQRTICSLNHLTLSSGRLLISTPRAGGTTAVTASVVSCHFPRCSKLGGSGNCLSGRGVEIIILISIEIPTQPTRLSTV